MERGRFLAGALSPILAAICLLPPGTASAQAPALELRLHRSFGYSWGGDIQGSFLLTATGPEDLSRVTFYVDEAVLETATAPPFQARLHTGDYPLGEHRLRAEGTSADGSTLVSNEIVADFVDPRAGWETAGALVLPILVIVGAVIAAGAIFTAISGRRYKPGVYGSSGGAICPNCSLPMSRHFLSPNLGVGKKLERCPHCGKWSRVARAGAAELAEAEARLLGEGLSQPTADSEAAALRRKVDESRFLE